jgi:hypothetical protein
MFVLFPRGKTSLEPSTIRLRRVVIACAGLLVVRVPPDRSSNILISRSLDEDVGRSAGGKVAGSTPASG